MRVVKVIGLMLAGGGGLATLSAQHAHQLEIGGFGSYTRFDRAFQLDNQFGAGGRLGFFLNDYIGFEVDASATQPTYKIGGAKTTAAFGSASLVLNTGAGRNVLYVLGGYGRLHLGPTGPMTSDLNAVQGGIGDRIFFTDRAALRLEARAFYRPGGVTPTGAWVGHVMGTAGLSFFLGGAAGGAPAPEIPKAKRDSILAAGGQVPQTAPVATYEAAPLPGEHAFQFEISGFGAYTRFDRAFQLDNQFGGGGRLGFWLTDWLEIEGEGLYQRPHPTGGGANIPVWFGSGSLVLNFGSEKSLYVLGGYSAMDFNSNGGGFRDVGLHGGIGDRIYISNTDKVALRLEARAYYAPNTKLPGGTMAGQIVGSAGLSFFLGPGHRRRIPGIPEIPKAKRDSILAAGGQLPETRPQGGGRPGPSYENRASDWAHKWYWGAQGGLFVFKTNFDSYSFEPTFGGHWLITGKKTALYVAYEQSFFLSERHATIVEPDGTVNPGNVSFKDARRIMAGVLAFPAQLRVEPFGGMGFAIVELLNPVASCASCSSLAQAAQLQDEAENAASKAFFWWMGGIDIKQGRLALYGHYILTSSAASFLIQGTTHTFQGGIRYALGTAKEGVTDR